MELAYDEEYMIKDLEQCFKDNLNAEIALINQEKGCVAGDDMFLDDVPTDSYVYEIIDQSILNYSGFFAMFGLVDNPITGNQTGNALENVKISFEIATFDGGESVRRIILYKLLRYRRAVKAVIFKNPDVFRNYAKPLLASLKPNALPIDNNVVILKSGVDVTASVTAY